MTTHFPLETNRDLDGIVRNISKISLLHSFLCYNNQTNRSIMLLLYLINFVHFLHLPARFAPSDKDCLTLRQLPNEKFYSARFYSLYVSM